MSKYKINVTVNLVECDAKTDDTPIELDDGSYQLTISEQAGESIDDCEKALLKTAFPAIRHAIAQHMETLSKKTLNFTEAIQIGVNDRLYYVDLKFRLFGFLFH